MNLKQKGSVAPRPKSLPSIIQDLKKYQQINSLELTLNPNPLILKQLIGSIYLSQRSTSGLLVINIGIVFCHQNQCQNNSINDYMLSGSSLLNKRSHNRHHQQSLDDFMKNIKKLNQKSERHLSPKPLLYMYSKPHHLHTHTNHTLQRSRSISNRRSTSNKKSSKTRKTTSKLRKKVDRMLDLSEENPVDLRKGNPGDIIEAYTEKIRHVEKYLNKKSQLGTSLCQKFQEMLNNIVENMIDQLNQKMIELERTVENRVERQLSRKYERNYTRLNNYTQKLQQNLTDMVEKQYYNNQIMYRLRTGWPEMGIERIDIDLLFGQIYGIEGLGGNGYNKSQNDAQQGCEGMREQGNDDITDRKEISKRIKDAHQINEQSFDQQQFRIQKQSDSKQEAIHQAKILKMSRNPYEEPGNSESSDDSARYEFRIREKLPEVIQETYEGKHIEITEGEQYIRKYKEKHRYLKIQSEFGFQRAAEQRRFQGDYRQKQQVQRRSGQSSGKKFDFS